MPVVIYIFALSAFALGLAEFVPIGLTEAIAGGLGVSIEQAGGVVTTYALGATFAAPVLTAFTAGWQRKRVMVMTALIFSAGSLTAAFAGNLPVMSVARFFAGMGHGLFLAVASSTAASLVGPKKAGTAVSVVFSGFTLALAIGVPVSTYVGGIIAWRPVLAAIGMMGIIAGFGLLLGMKPQPQSDENIQRNTVGSALKSLFNPVLLLAAFVTLLGYAGSFTAFTYIVPLLTEVTGVSPSSTGIFMLLYGLFAVLGNVLGGKLTDQHGANKASIGVLVGIGLTSLSLWAFSSSVVTMGILVALLGLFSYAAVPALQARLLQVAQQRAPHAHAVASGLNIAGFNSGIAVGSVLGGLTLRTAGITYMGIAGAIVTGFALVVLYTQIGSHQAVKRPARVNDGSCG